MSEVKILDCTLRDGGYVNDWKFGFENIKDIIFNLEKARVDFIECGFLKKNKYDKDKTFFDSFDNLKHLISCNKKIKYTLMINYGDVDIDDIPDNSEFNFIIRVAFKKHNFIEALEYCKQLKNKGFDLFINPMNTNTYSKDELSFLIDKVNDINPSVLTVVDTNGEMFKNDLIHLVHYIDKRLSKNISLAFHFHNSMQMSFSNAETVISENLDRNIIIDSTLFGIGRGAGNLCIELLISYLNKVLNKDYDLIPILNIIDKQITPIYLKNPWGYCIPYYLSAKNSCHPNYSHFLSDNNICSSGKIDEILDKIPNEFKNVYNEQLIKKLINEYT